MAAVVAVAGPPHFVFLFQVFFLHVNIENSNTNLFHEKDTFTTRSYYSVPFPTSTFSFLSKRVSMEPLAICLANHTSV